MPLFSYSSIAAPISMETLFHVVLLYQYFYGCRPFDADFLHILLSIIPHESSLLQGVLGVEEKVFHPHGPIRFRLCAKWNFITIDPFCIFCDYSARFDTLASSRRLFP
jgi:hypothetical protein